MIDLHAVHEKHAKAGRLTIHPSRWLHAGRRFGSVFDMFSNANQAVKVGDNCVSQFRQLDQIELAGKKRFGSGHYFASETIADKYSADVPSGQMLERAVRDMMVVHDRSARIEVKTPAGCIDMLTSDAVIEIKRMRMWKQALGQVLAYSAYYPRHMRVIHLFGVESEYADLPVIAQVSHLYGVVVRTQLLMEVDGVLSRLGPTVSANAQS